MRLHLFLLVLLSLLPEMPRAWAQAPLGGVAATFPIAAASLAADPVRDRVYAVVSVTNSVLVIDTTNFQVTTIAVGPQPVDLAVSPDGGKLYVANSGSTAAAISVIDLNTLTVVASLSLPNAPEHVAAGPGGRVYATALPDPNNASIFNLPNQPLSNPDIYQLDDNTSTATTPFAKYHADSTATPVFPIHTPFFYGIDFLRLNPDGKTLFIGDTRAVATYDVSSAVPVPLATGSANGTGASIYFSHNGTYFCVPGTPRLASDTSSNTGLYSTADLTTVYGTLMGFDAPMAFSLDDATLYNLSSAGITAFDTQTLAQIQQSAALSNPSSTGLSVTSGVIDRTGSYFFLSETYGTGYLGTSTAQQVAAVTTGTGTLKPSSLAPVITSSHTATVTLFVPFAYQIVATNTPTSYSATYLPSGLSLDKATGLISGTITDPGGAYPLTTISATNDSGTGSVYLQILLGAPTITSPDNALGRVGQHFSYRIAATNLPTSYGADGLPDGLSLDPATGRISGVPTVAGSFNVTVAATNKTGTGRHTLGVIVSHSLPTVDATATAPIVTAGSGNAGEITLTRTGDTTTELDVLYSIRGTAQNGTDYRALTGHRKIKAGKASAKIHVVPNVSMSGGSRTVRVVLQPSEGYQMGATKAKVTIEPAQQ